MDALTASDPTVVGGYRLLARLGAGGMGRVYLGRSASGRMVAVKLVHPGLAEEPDFRGRFAREVAAVQRVGGRWTAPVLDADTESSVPWLATGYVPGPALREVVESLHGPLPEGTVWTLARGLSEALRDIHAAGLVHRDLKPSNVLVTLDGPQVIDFGIAKAVDASVATRTGAVIGSPGFMAPEQARADELTPAVDVFALGAVLVHAATGTAPFSGGAVPPPVVFYRLLHEEPELGSLSGPLRDLAARCLVRDPAARPSVDEVARLAAEHAADPADGTWLPGALATRLGRDAVRLLALESPLPAPAPAPAPVPAPVSAPEPAPEPSPSPLPDQDPAWHARTSTAPGPRAPGAPTVPPLPATPPPTAPRRGRRVALAGGAVAVVAALVLLRALLPAGGEDEPEGKAPTAPPSSSGEPSAEASEGTDADAPLRELLPPEIRDSGVLTLGHLGAYPPMSFSGDVETGVDRELAAAIGELLDVELMYQPVDFETVHQSLVYDEVDVVFNMSSTVDAQGFPVDYVDYYQAGNVFLVPGDGATDGAAALDAVCGGTVVTFPTPKLREVAERAIEECGAAVQVEDSTDPAAMFEAVRSGDADAALLNYPTAVHETGPGEQADGLAIAGEQQAVDPFRIGVTRGHDGLVDAVQQAVQTLMDDGTYEEILAAHGLEDCALSEARRHAGD